MPHKIFSIQKAVIASPAGLTVQITDAQQMYSAADNNTSTEPVVLFLGDDVLNDYEDIRH
jgi:hypothetical protein